MHRVRQSADAKKCSGSATSRAGMNAAFRPRMRLLAIVLLAACAGAPEATTDEADLNDGLGTVESNGQWGAATTCKDGALPTGLPQLRNPAVVVSLDGLT